MIRRALGKTRRLICARRNLATGLIFLTLSSCGLIRCTPDPLPQDQFEALYDTPLKAPESGLRVFHLGHSLVNRDMPAMIAQLAQSQGLDHAYDSQIGWGTPLKSHWEPDEEVFGFAQENDHPRFRDVFDALDSGDYEALIATEMVEIRDAIAYFDSAEYLHRFAARARAGRPDIRIYLYETWHEVTDPEGWRQRLEKDRVRYWQDGILRPAVAYDTPALPIYIIPVGQVLAEVAHQIEAGELPELTTAQDLFARTDDGALDPIHVDALGNYIAALTHYAVLYQRDPTGLPVEVNIYDKNQKLRVASPALAERLQGIVWQVVSTDPMTGVAALR